MSVWYATVVWRDTHEGAYHHGKVNVILTEEAGIPLHPQTRASVLRTYAKSFSRNSKTLGVLSSLGNLSLAN